MRPRSHQEGLEEVQLEFCTCVSAAGYHSYPGDILMKLTFSIPISMLITTSMALSCSLHPISREGYVHVSIVDPCDSVRIVDSKGMQA